MGPNGSGKSTLGPLPASLATKSPAAILRGEGACWRCRLTSVPQRHVPRVSYPVEIPGVAVTRFLRTALNAQRKARGESEYSTPDFLKKVREVAKRLNIPQDMLRRGGECRFSGGEKKRNKILQMALFEPSLHSGRDGLRSRHRRAAGQPPMVSTHCARRNSNGGDYAFPAAAQLHRPTLSTSLAVWSRAATQLARAGGFRVRAVDLKRIL